MRRFLHADPGPHAALPCIYTTRAGDDGDVWDRREHDATFALRLLWKDEAFSLATVQTLALLALT
jgi:hypothetical protein